MTCKDCIHSKVCDEEMQYEVNDVVENCGYFKDRSKFIELPCKVGDYVYFINGKNVIIRTKILCVKTTQSTLYYNPEHIEITLGCEKSRGILWLDLDKVKNIYFSKEEAEQALRERNNETR